MNMKSDLSLSLFPGDFTSEEVHKLQLCSYLAEYCKQRPILIPMQLSDEEAIFYISTILTERVVFLFGEMTLFPVLPLSVQYEICQLFVPLSFIMKSFATLIKQNENLNILESLKCFNDLSLLPPEIYLPVKASYKSNPSGYEKIIAFLAKYSDVIQRTPKCLLKDFRMILLAYIYLLYEYLSEMRSQHRVDLPHLSRKIHADLASVNELFKKLTTAQYGGEIYREILKVLPDLTQLTGLFGSLTLTSHSAGGP